MTKTIFVTCGAGFIGSNYLNKYVPLHPEYIFVNIDSLTSAGSLGNISVSEAANYRFHQIDIRDLAALEALFEKYRPSGIIHFAAESHVDVSIANPAIFVETNIIGTHNLLMLAKKHGVERFHQISTDEVYGSLGKNDAPFTTHSPITPNSPYSASKAAADHLVRAYHETYGLNTVVTRCSNNYGPNQDLSKIIPKFITNLLKGEKVPLYAKGENVRDWIYVEDHVDAIDLVFHRGVSGEIYNIGGGKELSNIELTRILLSLTGRDEGFVQEVADRPGHDFRYAIDSTEIEKELGWKPHYTFEKGILVTIAFFKKTLLK